RLGAARHAAGQGDTRQGQEVNPVAPTPIHRTILMRLQIHLLGAAAVLSFAASECQARGFGRYPPRGAGRGARGGAPGGGGPAAAPTSARAAPRCRRPRAPAPASAPMAASVPAARKPPA